MAQQIINNGESGLVVRNKLNANFTELYSGATGGVVSLPSVSGAVNIDLSTGRIFHITQTGNITSFTFTGETVGTMYMFVITRTTTNYTFTLATGKYRLPMGAAITLTNPTLNGSPGVTSTDIITAVCNVAGRLDLTITMDLQNN